MLTRFADVRQLSVPLLDGLARLLEMLSSWFNSTLGERLLEHLEQWTNPARGWLPSIASSRVARVRACRGRLLLEK